MIDISRRNLLAGAAALSAVSPLGLSAPAFAAAPLAGKQNAGFYRTKLGSLELTVVTDGARVAPLADNFVRNAKKDEVNAALRAAFMKPDEVVTPFNPMVVNTGSKLVLLDTGSGAGALAQTKGTVGQLQDNLVAAGIQAGSIDTVCISHFHGDHINGLLTADGKPAFANAEVMVPATEWAFWMDDANMNKAPEAAQGAFKNARRVFAGLGNKVTQYKDAQELAPGITAVATPGHTPGHTSFNIASGDASLFWQADVTNVPVLFARNPGWHAIFDMDPAMAEATRRKVYDRLAADRQLMAGFHYPFPAIAFIEKDGNGYRPSPAPWSPTI